MIGRAESGDAVPGGAGGIARSFVGQRMRACKFDHLHRVAGLAQAGDDAAIVGVAAGDGRKWSGDEEAELRHGRRPMGAMTMA